MFESEFLSSNQQGRERYLGLVSQAAQAVCDFIPDAPYRGLNAGTLASFVPADFLPDQGSTADEINSLFRTVVENSVAVNHPRTAAHLHCPPLLAALAAEVVISALNQSMDSFDQAPIATVIEQKMISWLCAQAGLPATSAGTFTTGGSQSNYMALLLARDAVLDQRVAPRVALGNHLVIGHHS